MNDTTRARLLAQANELVKEGEAVLATEFCRSRPGYVDMRDPWVDLELFERWNASCRNFVLQIGDQAKAWDGVFDSDSGNQFVVAQAKLGQLRAICDSIERNMLVRIEDFVAADAFGSLLDQATELLRLNYVIAAGVLCRAVLEEHLRNLCHRTGCKIPGRPTIADMNMALYRSRHIDKLAMQGVTAMATCGNDCAHISDPPRSKADVEKLHHDVGDFLNRFPLS